MAKKSAKSKGYRKTVKAKPFLTKKEIIALIVIAAVILAGVIVVNLVSKAGTITAKQVESTDIIGFASTNMRDRYVKLGTINDLEGYTREGGPTQETPTASHQFVPADETSPLDRMSVSTAVYDASTAADITMSYYAGTLEMSEKFETTVYDMPAYVFSASGSYYDETLETKEVAEDAAAETAEEPAHNVYTQSLSMYVTVDEGRSIAMHAYINGEDDSKFIPDDQVVEFMQALTPAFTPIAE